MPAIRVLNLGMQVSRSSGETSGGDEIWSVRYFRWSGEQVAAVHVESAGDSISTLHDGITHETGLKCTLIITTYQLQDLNFI